GVLGIRKGPRFVQKLRGSQAREPVLYSSLVRARDGVQQHGRHIPADDRCRLEQLFVGGGQSLDARRENRLYGGRHLDLLNRSRRSIGATIADERTGFDERLDALLDEEGIAAPDQQSLEGLQGRILTKNRVQELARVLGRKRIEPQLAVVRLASPPMLVAGTVGDDQH